MTILECDKGSVRRPAAARGPRLSRAAALAAALTIATGLSCIGSRLGGPAIAQAQPHAHPHVDKPASVATASDPNDPTDANHEVVVGGDTKKVIHWQALKPPAVPVKLGDYKGVPGKKIAYVATWRHPSGTTPPANNPNKLFQASYDGKVVVSRLGNFGPPPTAVITTFTHPPAMPNQPEVEVWCVAGSLDGTLAVSGTNYGELQVWDPNVDPATPKGTLAGAGSFYPVGGLAFRKVQSGNRQFLAARDGGEVVRYELVPIAGGKFNIVDMNKTFSHGNDLAVNAVAVTDAGDVAVSAGFDMTVRVWNIETLAETIIRDNRNIVWRVAISPDDQLFATASDDGSVRLYNIDGTPVMDNTVNPPLPAKVEEVDTDGTKLGIMGVTFAAPRKVVYTLGKDPPNPNNDPSIKVWDVSALKP